ncbi:protein-L-isoaspartate(D-aspartate) O-methyltransferase [Candidatus Berkiella cookevillensis]|uniref:Protein-L-isoaspartate O-methyltransferase n=1 Tax=Candidatus Berkiella cookevillensis TaxID=437022 RepID=A0A0Q9YCA4_9GAMM|nr:protein-L-isoaspartate(D-aspartate) O-methyltransferase [Candidatus Berkiella cookevillensis]MCS5708671.1 protein-L-isoaspartate(D-aspartate) O-methyltransferase [Candidatus Berkiella cookevillensis]
MNQTKELIAELKKAGIHNPKVLEAIQNVPRNRFIHSKDSHRAFKNIALPIDCQQTISQPYIVALMTEALFRHNNPQKILEIGTGSGYQSAILAYLFPTVFSIERILPLHKSATERLKALNIRNVQTAYGDGFIGWQEHAPYDGILVTACAPEVPISLLAQLSPKGGVLVIPLASQKGAQELRLFEKQDDKITSSHLEFVSFVPLLAGTHDPNISSK